jgi:hypothetical protein
MDECLRYLVALCQTDQANPLHRSEMKRNTESMLRMLEDAVVGYAPFMPVRLVVFPEFGHAARPYYPGSCARNWLSLFPMSTRRDALKAKEFGYISRVAAC